MPRECVRSTRRDFMRVAGLTVGIGAVAAPAALLAANQAAPNRDPEAVLKRLVEGNQRFMKGESTRMGRKPADFAADAQGQAPLAIIIGCADSRVAPHWLLAWALPANVASATVRLKEHVDCTKPVAPPAYDARRR